MLDSYPDIMHTSHICEIFGWKPATVAAKARNGEIPARKIGKHYYFAKTLIVQFMTAGEPELSQADIDKVHQLR
jgi:hypothetical protein